MMKKVYFNEVQRFGSVSLYAAMGMIYAVTLGYFAYALIDTFVLEGNIIEGHMSKQGLVIGSVLVLIILSLAAYLLFGSKLITEATSDSIIYSFPPFINNKRIISKNDISDWEIREYKPIKEYGGWGVRYGQRKGKIYLKKGGVKNSAVNVKGNMGLQLILKNGERLLIGTQRPQAFKRAMRKMIGN